MVRTSIFFFALAIGMLLLGIYGIGGISFGMGRLLLFLFLFLSLATFSWDLISAASTRYKRRHKKNGTAPLADSGGN